MGFNKVAVSQFNSLLNEIIDKHKLTADKIFNCDETGLSVNPKSQSKIIALKGKRQVGAITSAERGETVTAEVCMSASGLYMPPMLIFPRIKKKQEFELGLPPGGWSEVHSSGWMTTELFLVWFTKFLEFSKATKESPVLLIVDGHSTHTKNLQLLDMARNNGVVLLCLPPHTSHKLQPLDVTFFKPLSLYYGEEVRKWLRSHPGKVVTLFQISSIFGAAFLHAATMPTAINGFQKTGIWPSDLNVFSDADYLPSATTDIQLENSESPSANSTDGQSHNSTTDSPVSTEPPAKKTKTNQDSTIEPQPGCSWVPDSPNVLCSQQNSAFRISPKNLIPIPLIRQNTKRTSRRKGKTVVLTGSPYKNELQDAVARKERKEKEKEHKNKGKEVKNATKGKSVAKNLFKKIKTGKSNCTPKKLKGEETKGLKKIKKKKKIAESESDEEEAECLYCGDLYSISNEGWVACQKCFKWAHNSCAGIDNEDDEEILICEFCQEA